MDQPLHILILAVVIGALSVARTARLLIHDAYPPTTWLRMKWDSATENSDWNLLFHCQYCLTPYLAAGMSIWAYYSDLNRGWWVVNGVWGISYLCAILVSYDQPEG